MPPLCTKKHSDCLRCALVTWFESVHTALGGGGGVEIAPSYLRAGVLETWVSEHPFMYPTVGLKIRHKVEVWFLNYEHYIVWHGLLRFNTTSFSEL